MELRYRFEQERQQIALSFVREQYLPYLKNNPSAGRDEIRKLHSQYQNSQLIEVTKGSLVVALRQEATLIEQGATSNYNISDVIKGVNNLRHIKMTPGEATKIIEDLQDYPTLLATFLQIMSDEEIGDLTRYQSRDEIEDANDSNS